MPNAQEKPRIAVIGASYLQLPLIEKARDMGYEVHAFAWEADDVGERAADVFHPISIVEKERIADACREIGIEGVCTIASDLGGLTASYVASELGLPGNGMDCTRRCTNKHAMREAFEAGGDPSPRSMLVLPGTDLDALAQTLSWPVIVKPTDRSGSRGIAKLDGPEGFSEAVATAMACGFEKAALVEEFAEGTEYSVECVSYQGRHLFLALTLKHTTGAPRFIETGHEEPAPVDAALLERIQQVVFHALDSLGVTCGASHSEVKVDDTGAVRIIEIGARMGGDLIGSDLVFLSTGLDFVGMVVDIACGRAPDFTPHGIPRRARVRFILTEHDAAEFERLLAEDPGSIWRHGPVDRSLLGGALDSSSRAGWYVTVGDPL